MPANPTPPQACAPHPEPSPEPVSPRAYAMLALLFLCYLLNYLDRALIFILLSPIKAEMKLSELQLALLGSTSFVIFYTTLGLPFGRLADRVNRTRMIAIGLILWSAFSGLTGFARGFYGIFLCRVGVGIGEATLGPAALSLLSDLFPSRARATASAMFSAGIPLGAGIALYLGGMIGQALGWRWAFYLLGFPGILFALLVWQVREPTRGTQDRTATEPRAPAESTLGPLGGLGRGLREIFRQRTIQLLLLGYSFFSMASSALGLWIPSFLDKNFKVPLAVAGRYAGLCAALGGLFGVLGGGVGADWFRRRSPGGRLRFTALCALFCAPLWLILLRAQSVPGVLVPFALLMGLGLMWLGPAAADMQDLVGPEQRGLGIGVYFFVVNVIASGLGQPVIGAVSDRLGVGADPSQMRVSLLICPAAALLAAILLGLASISRVRAGQRPIPHPATD